MYRNDDNRGVSAGCCWSRRAGNRQWARAGKLPVAPRLGKSARRANPGPLFLRKVWQSARLMTCGVLLQASGCAFDSEAFLGDSLSALFDNIATTLIITALADLLGVTPSFGF